MNTTDTQEWFPLTFHPDWYETLEVRLPDGTVARAVWTGTKWWSTSGAISPTNWRPLQPATAA
jgi:hypothetical protein